MGRIRPFIKSFFDVRHSIKARFFICFIAVTLTITVGISLYWYQKIIQSTTDTIEQNMELSITSSLAQLENSFEDIKLMHSTVIYETNSLNYIVREDDNPPNLDWFQDYIRLYTNLHTMGITLSRTLSGTGIYKMDGSTCVAGTLGLGWDASGLLDSQRIRAGEGQDVLLFLEKPKGEVEGEAPRYLFVGRSILDKGEERAVIVSKVNEGLLVDIFRSAMYPGGFVLALDGEHNVIYDSAPGAHDDHKARYMAQLQRGEALAADQGFTLLSARSDHTGVTVISAVSNRFIKESYRTVRGQLLLILAAAVLVVAGVSLLVANRITLGLQQLARNMKRAGEGAMTTTDMIPIRGEDEVGRLYQAFLSMIGQIQNLLRDIKDNEHQKRIMEIKVLRAQVSPHFLYNSLNTINYLALLQNAQNIHVLASSLIDLLQGAVNVDDVLIPVADEIKYVQSYVNIQQYRFPREIRVDYRVDDALASCLVPKMILQPIVENALIHGFKEDCEDPVVTIKAYTLDYNSLIISVTDNGVGMSEDAVRRIMERGANRDKMRFSGIGISNVDTRIKLQLGESYGLSVYSREGQFTTVEIRVPVRCEPLSSPELPEA